jgi:ATP-binding cassette subfamily B (MDR/TAP) protein 1
MKDLGAAKQILGMRIFRDKDKGVLKLSQTEYVKNPSFQTSSSVE